MNTADQIPDEDPNERPITIEERINREPLYKLYRKIWNVLIINGFEQMVGANVGEYDGQFCIEFVAKKEGGFDHFFEELLVGLFEDIQFSGINMSYIDDHDFGAGGNYSEHTGYRLTSDFEISSTTDANVFFRDDTAFRGSN